MPIKLHTRKKIFAGDNKTENINLSHVKKKKTLQNMRIKDSSSGHDGIVTTTSV